MGPDFLGYSTTFSCTQAKRETASHTCPGVAPHSIQTRHPRPWLVCSGTENSALRDCPRIIYRTSASSRKPMVVALSSNTYCNSGAPRWPRSALVQKTLTGHRVASEAPRPTATRQVSSIFILCFIFLSGFYYTVRPGLELASILITGLCGAVQFLRC